jgi:hypothetical protein
LKRTLVTVSLLIASYGASLAVVDLGNSTTASPYEEHMDTVKKVLRTLPNETTTMKRAEELMKIGFGFRYSFNEPYKAALPSVTAALHAGDCKAKALWLCNQLGDGRARFVIGKSSVRSPISHAWVMWKHGGRWWILDCTQNSRPIAADRVSSNKYIPFYSYDRDTCYRHAAGPDYESGIAASKPVGARP